MSTKNTNKFRDLIRDHAYPFLFLICTISLSSIAINLFPISESMRLKNSCINSAKKSLKNKSPNVEEYGINIDELASIEGYRFCTQKG